MRIGIAALSCLLLMASFAIVPASADAVYTTCAVQVDFGNGQIAWADIAVTPGMDAFEATIQAAGQIGLVVNATNSSFGWSINSISGIGDNDSTGGWNPATGEYWAFWTWNPSTDQWESSWVGASATDANSVPAIAWTYYASWALTPAATPDNRYPWTSYRHDNLNSGAQGAYAPNNLTLKWAVDLGNGNIDSPIVSANGYQYAVTSGALNTTDYSYETEAAVFCLNSTGGEVWNQSIGAGSFQICSPLIYGSLVVVPSANGIVYAFDAMTGASLWSFDTQSGNVYGSPSPIAYRGLIYVASADGKLFALHENGTEAWNSTVATAIYSSSPAAWDGVIYIGAEDGKLRAFFADNGTEKWSAAIGGKVRGFPLVTESAVVVTYTNSSTAGGLAWVGLDGDVLRYAAIGASPASAALTSKGFAAITATDLYLVSFTGQKLWNVSLGTQMAGAAPTSVDGTIFLVTNEAESRVMAISESGETYWQMPLSPAQFALSAPTVADGVLYVSSDNGKVYAFNLNNVAPPAALFVKSVDKMKVNLTVASASGSNLYEYKWNFGDGNTSTGKSVSHTYAKDGNYTVTLTISNPAGQSTQTSSFVNIVTPAPAPKSDDTLLIVIGVLAVLLVVAIAVMLVRRRK